MLPRRLDAGLVGHLQVHEDDIGLELGGQGDRLGAAGCLAHDLEIGRRRQQRAQAMPKDGMIVSQQDAQRSSLM